LGQGVLNTFIHPLTHAAILSDKSGGFPIFHDIRTIGFPDTEWVRTVQLERLKKVSVFAVEPLLARRPHAVPTCRISDWSWAPGSPPRRQGSIIRRWPRIEV
jgi:hypothetical protein